MNIFIVHHLMTHGINHLTHVDAKLRKAVDAQRSSGFDANLASWLCLLFSDYPINHPLPKFPIQLKEPLNSAYIGVHVYFLVTPKHDTKTFFIPEEPSIKLLLMFKDACDQYGVDWISKISYAIGYYTVNLFKLGDCKDEAF